MKRTRKPKYCQFVEGTQNRGVSTMFNCFEKTVFQVHHFGVLIAHVCPKHSWDMTQKGFQVR